MRAAPVKEVPPRIQRRGDWLVQERREVLTDPDLGQRVPRSWLVKLFNRIGR